MNLNHLSKKQSGFIFLIVYVFTMIAGALLYIFGVGLWVPPIILMLVVDVFMTLVIFIIGSIIKNASLYDPYWSVIPLFIILVWTPIYAGSFLRPSILIVLIVVAAWSIRLTYNWWKNWKGFSEQDWRYDMLREKNIKLYPLTNLMGIHLIPTLVVYLQMIAIYRILLFGTVNIGFIIGALISLSAPIIQFISDKQMYDFRKNNTQRQSVINTGLWRFSRHPNYFGELSFWVGIYVMYLSVAKTLDWYILFPLAMILLFVFISVPMMEKKLENRPGYNEYKDSVSMIIPFFPKRNKQP